MTLPITTLEYKDLIAKARTLKEQLDNDNLDKSFLKEFIEFTLKTAPKDFNTTKLTKDDIKTLFVKYLEKEFPNKQYQHYWDYRDELASSDLEEILKLANLENAKSFVQAATWYIFQEYPETETYDIDYVISEFYNTYNEKVDEIKDLLDWEEYSFLSEIFYNTIDYDLDVETLLRHSSPEDLTVYFGETWDDAYADIEYDFIQMFNEPEFLTNNRNTPIDWLMQTQGYSREDLISEEKREKSVFLTTLIILLTAIFIHNETKLEYTSNSEWKTVYENDIDAEIILNLKTENGYLISNAIAGKSIEKDYKDYSQNSNMNGTILAKKGDLEENKTIHIKKEDIIYDGELKPTSKITKIEYRPAQQMYKTVFGYNGKPKSADIDGLVRITISDDNSPERTALKSLFTN